MINTYFIQMVGVLATVAGFAGLTATAYVYGRRLDRNERTRMGTDKNTYRLPLNLETIASLGLVLLGIGILAWSNFNMCSYMLYWLPSLSEPIRFWLAC